ncbi:DUF262 domain-containing protein [Limibacillus halophilus]|uniref:GmrSD restriction endonucleases N-terminal domain-containing protein n=1 Tax=Limibacillus halophilus TaxID=1579333 RepID=A0A839SW70_9PROT|nr:DUF262 domain-containing protein [Limibacillus halophilus]MBB3065205.1 hypothetical protein [Limibacillus halophilus]
MKNFDTRVYNISDFIEWRDTNLLDLSPEFQRRSVWTEKAKSYLVDTILRGKPIPKMLLTQKLESKRNVRIVVDGQQRLRAILDFYDGNFKISRAHSKRHAGKVFESLSPEERNEFLKYEIGVDLLYDIPYKEILDIFARINTYTVKLNGQESRNAKYLGFFKQTAYRLGYDIVEYLIESKVLTKSSVNRMAEAELASDLLTSLIGGVQTNKNVETYYKRFEDESGPLEEKAEIFYDTARYVSAIYPNGEMALTNWSRIQLFYSLFLSISHFLHGVDNIEVEKIKIKPKDIGKIRVVLDEISARYDEYTSASHDLDIPEEFELFIDRSRRATTDTASRKFRSEFICLKLGQALST